MDIGIWRQPARSHSTADLHGFTRIRFSIYQRRALAHALAAAGMGYPWESLKIRGQICPAMAVAVALSGRSPLREHFHAILSYNGKGLPIALLVGAAQCQVEARRLLIAEDFLYVG